MHVYHMSLSKLAGVSALWCIFGAAMPAVAEEPIMAGRFVLLGMTEASSDWKLQHPADQRLLYRLNSATGAIEVCGDVEGRCRTIPGSERDDKGFLVGRFAGLQIVPATADWKAKNPHDDRLVYSMDSSSGEIQVCGNVNGGCVVVVSRMPVRADRRPQVVMLYRRANSAAITGRIYDRLVAHYGPDTVFMDIYSIPLATDWREQVKRMSLQGGAVVVVIGPKWLGQQLDGHVRIDDVDDPVRTELELAFQAHLPIFPVLVEGVSMPSAAELPSTLKEFSNINAASVGTGREFDQQVARLIGSIDRRLANRAAPDGVP